MPLESSRFRTKLYQLTNHLQNVFSLKNAKWVIWCLIALSLIIIDSKLILRGSGYYPKPNIEQILIFSYLIIIFSSSKKIFWFLLFPFILIYALYTPIGLTFGGPTYQHISSLVATDTNEAKEFLLQIPYKNYLYAISIIIIIVAYRIITVKFRINFFKNKFILSIATLYLLFNMSPFDFFRKTYIEALDVKRELDTLNKLSLKSEWGDTYLENSKYDDYILIIGESARRDYLHAYGYPIANTPFMSSSKGILIDGLESAGFYTIGSLKLMLTKPDTSKWEENYSLNLIDLIKSAGIKTYWLSNQGYLGEWDTPISAIGNKADYKFFIKKGKYDEQDTDDTLLLPYLENIINQESKEKRFIVIHLYGSHPNACDRIKNKDMILNDKEFDEKYFYLNCYITSIKETDKFIENTYNLMNNVSKVKNRKFSIVYFSDHGQCHSSVNPPNVIVSQACTSKLHNDVPLFKISSDDINRKEYKVFKSGLNFTDGIANWIGIANNKLNKNIDLFSDQSDTSDYGLKERIDKREIPLDPAIDIRITN